MAIPNKYKDAFNNFIDISDLESSNWPWSIDKGSHNVFRSKSSSTKLLKAYCLYKDVSDSLVRQVPETRDS